jgi:hypothetical protein
LEKERKKMNNESIQDSKIEKPCANDTSDIDKLAPESLRMTPMCLVLSAIAIMSHIGWAIVWFTYFKLSEEEMAKSELPGCALGAEVTRGAIAGFYIAGIITLICYGAIKAGVWIHKQMISKKV